MAWSPRADRTDNPSASCQDASGGIWRRGEIDTNGYSLTTGLLDTVLYPTSTAAVSGSRLEIKYDYANGQLKRARDTSSAATTYWEQLTADARGNPSDVLLGNGLHTYSTFDAVDGGLRSRTTGTSGAIQKLTYDWDKVGNLTLRKDAALNLTERFYYDALDRLDYSTLNNATNLDLAYDAIGNITSKTSSNAAENVGNYTYHTTRKHAVVTAGSHSYGYDANGNMNLRDGSTIAYTSYNLPSQVNSGSNSIQYYYGPARNRYKEVTLVAAGPLPAGTETTLSVGGLFEKVTKPSGVVEYKHYIAAGSEPVAIVTLRSNSQNDTRYLHKDHLDGIDAVTDAAGALVARFSYSAFGGRRASSTWSGTPSSTEWSAIAGVTHRGLTALEHADNVGLIHMNGRMYDPLIGRFISPDPMVPSSLGTQGANRYSYVGNNPLTLTDRTGFDPGDDGVKVIGPREGHDDPPGPPASGMTGSGGPVPSASASEQTSRASEANANIQKAPYAAPEPQSSGTDAGLLTITGAREKSSAPPLVLAPIGPSALEIVTELVIQGYRGTVAVISGVSGATITAVAGGALLLLAPSNGIAGHDYNDESLAMAANKAPKDAKDPNGAKAPGKPGKAEGFEDPKDGEQWTTDGKGRGGWLDSKGNLWQPTGHGGRVHGGPHWDVQLKKGGYSNVRPGQKLP